jgi:DmsE family decaheme c-type cytochrome
MKFLRQIVALLAFVGAMGVIAPAFAEDAPKAAGEKKPEKDLVLKGDAKCTSCHDEADAPELLAIGKTMHGTTADGRAPTCTKCHGASEEHVLNAEHTNVRPKPDRTFTGQLAPSSIPVANRVEHYFGLQGKLTTTPVDERNEACLECHKQEANRMLWEGSSHQAHDVACTSCHQIHTAHDKVKDRRTQADMCFACHKEQRAQANKQSHHPILEGKVVCSDCHNPHGSAGPKLMKRDSVVETCYTCHMEKRGPFVHNHQPVNDDCTNCHMPHGTVADNLLKARPPLVCYQCHSGHGTPGIAGIAPGISGSASVAGVSGSSAKANTNIEQGRGCLNCHTEIHGSNNPDGGQNLLPPAFFLR